MQLSPFLYSDLKLYPSSVPRPLALSPHIGVFQALGGFLLLIPHSGITLKVIREGAVIGLNLFVSHFLEDHCPSLFNVQCFVPYILSFILFSSMRVKLLPDTPSGLEADVSWCFLF